MAPRQAKRPTAPEIRDRNTRDLLGRPGFAGLARIGGIGARGGGGRSVLANLAPDESETVGAAKLLVLSATGDSIASGGDHVAFDTIVAQHGFDGVAPAAGDAWVHPISGVYLLTYQHAWDGYTGGGTIELELDGAVIPEGLIVPSGTGDLALGMVGYIAEAGQVGRVKVTQTSGVAQTCDASLHVIITDPSDAERDTVLLDTFYVDSRVHSQDPAHNTYAESAITLDSGASYTVVVDGNWTRYNDASLGLGSPDAIVYLSPGQAQRDAMEDADVEYASKFAGTYPRHTNTFVMNLGSGWAHVEPDSGSFTTPQAGHSYTFSVTGQGSTLKAAITDTPISDNNGQLRVRIYGTGG